MDDEIARLIVGTRHCRLLTLDNISGTKYVKYTVYINSGCAGMTSEDTAVPFAYARLIVGTRHCRVLISGYINSDATGIDITLRY